MVLHLEGKAVLRHTRLSVYRRRQDVELLLRSRDSLMAKAVIEAKRKPAAASVGVSV